MAGLPKKYLAAERAYKRACVAAEKCRPTVVHAPYSVVGGRVVVHCNPWCTVVCPVCKLKARARDMRPHLEVHRKRGELHTKVDKRETK